MGVGSQRERRLGSVAFPRRRGKQRRAYAYERVYPNRASRLQPQRTAGIRLRRPASLAGWAAAGGRARGRACWPAVSPRQSWVW